MSDYINRQKACEALEDLANYYNRENHEPVMANGILTARAKLIDIPTIDVAPVTHCKDCKYGIECKFKGELRFQCSQDIPDVIYQPNDFCSKGERKDGEK